MSFVYPYFLWALLAVSIPILIHLFHFRRFRTVYFTNVRFLREVKEQTASRSKIKHLLVLLTRIAAIIALVFAFAQPFIPNDTGKMQAGRTAVSIYIDNSFSMAAESEDVPLLEKARTRAQEIIQAYGPDDRFQILTTDFEGRDQRLLSRDDALSRLDEIQATFAVKPLSQALARQKQTLNTFDEKNKLAYVISDFQENVSQLDRWTDSSIQLYCIPLQAVATKNIAIDTAWFDAPVQMLGQTNQLIVKMHNYSDEAVSTRLQLRVDGQTRPEGELEIPAQTSVYDTVNVTLTRTGWHEASLTLTDYPIEFDNAYFFSFYVKEQVNILVLHADAPNRFVQAAYQNNQYFKATFTPVTQLDYSSLNQYDLIVLDQLPNISSGLAASLQQYIQSGGNTLLFPAQKIDLSSYNGFLQSLKASIFGPLDQAERQVSYVNFQEFTYRDVFAKRENNLRLPKTRANYRVIRKASSQEEVLLRYRDGQTFLAKYQKGEGTFYLHAAPLNTELSDFVQNGEVFVPLLYRAALATGKARKIAYTIGADENIETQANAPRAETVFKMLGHNQEFIPEQRNLGSRLVLGVHQQVHQAGFYDLFIEKGQILDKFAFNYNRQESNLRFLDEEMLQTQIGDKAAIIDGTQSRDFSTIIGTRSQGQRLWKWCLLAALGFLAFETLLLRFWRS